MILTPNWFWKILEHTEGILSRIHPPKNRRCVYVWRPSATTSAIVDRRNKFAERQKHLGSVWENGTDLNVSDSPQWNKSFAQESFLFPKLCLGRRRWNWASFLGGQRSQNFWCWHWISKIVLHVEIVIIISINHKVPFAGSVLISSSLRARGGARDWRLACNAFNQWVRALMIVGFPAAINSWLIRGFLHSVCATG